MQQHPGLFCGGASRESGSYLETKMQRNGSLTGLVCPEWRLLGSQCSLFLVARFARLETVKLGDSPIFVPVFGNACPE